MEPSSCELQRLLFEPLQSVRVQTSVTVTRAEANSQTAMQDALIFFLLPLTLLLVHIVSRLRLRHAPTRKAAYARLAAARSALLRMLHTLGLGQPDVYVTDRFATHRLLVRGAAAGGAFSDRPPSIVPSAVLSRRRHYNINSAPYGPLWRAVRRNLTSEILHPSRLHRYGPARRRALGGLVADLDRQRASGGVVLAVESLREAKFGLLAAMCFGGGVDAGLVRAMADTQDDLVQFFLGLRVFATLPAVTGLIYRNRWRKLVELRR
jgi:cytochrome P450 family 89 subfamily A